QRSFLSKSRYDLAWHKTVNVKGKDALLEGEAPERFNLPNWALVQEPDDTPNPNTRPTSKIVRDTPAIQLGGDRVECRSLVEARANVRVGSLVEGLLKSFFPNQPAYCWLCVRQPRLVARAPHNAFRFQAIYDLARRKALAMGASDLVLQT